MKAVFFVLLAVTVAPLTFAGVLPYGFLEVTSPEVPKTSRESLAKITKAVGRILIKAKVDINAEVKKGTPLDVGTGFVTQPGDVLTTSSNLVELWGKFRDKLELTFDVDGESIVVEKLLDTDEGRQLAHLALPKKRESFIAESTVIPEVGMQVANVAYPLAREKQKVTFGLIAKKAGEFFFLTNPIHVGCTGSPTLLIEADGQIKAFIGIVQASSATFADENLKGATAVDYLGFLEMNRRLQILLSVADPEKNFKVTKDEKGYQSKIVDGYLRPKEDTIYNVAIYNFDLLRSDTTLKKMVHNLTDAATGTEKFGKELSLLDTWPGKSEELLDSYLKVNNYFKKEADAMARYGKPLYNSALRPESELQKIVKDFKSPKDLTANLNEWAATMRAAEKQLTARIAHDKKKMEFHKSTDQVIAYALEVKKDPKLLDGEAHVNERFLYVPALISAAKQK